MAAARVAAGGLRPRRVNALTWLGVALLPGTAVADVLEAGVLRQIELAGAPPIRRRIVAVERPGARGTAPFIASLWGLLDRIPELIPRALPIHTGG